jgi:hypothetical protein
VYIFATGVVIAEAIATKKEYSNIATTSAKGFEGQLAH